MGILYHTGSVIVDQVYYIDHLPESGGDVVASATDTVAGGAMNSIIAATRDSMAVTYCGLIGNGPNSDIIARALAGDNIHCAFPRDTSADNGSCVALVEANGERSFITSIGIEGEFAYRHCEQIHPQPGDYVYISGYSLATAENADALTRWLPSLPQDVTVVFDPSPLVTELPRTLFEPMLLRADVVTANAREARALVIDDAAKLTTNECACQLAKYLKTGAWAVVRNGPEPTAMSRNTPQGPSQVTEVQGFPVEAVDTSGCGDVHTGVLIASLNRGSDMAEAVRRANAAAAIKATRNGPNNAPTAREIDDFVANYRSK